MNKTPHYQYVCGFNGFGQIDQISGQTSDSSTDQFYSSPQLMNVDCGQVRQYKFTWSDIWTVKEKGTANCFGFNMKNWSTASNLHNNSPITNIVPVQHKVLLQTKHGTSLVDEDKEHRLVVDIIDDNNQSVEDQVRLVSATDKMVMGIDDKGSLYEGKFHQSEATVHLKLHPLCLPLPVAMVSCGFEHTLIVTQAGTVYSYGQGSRGQLGHGDSSVDYLPLPTLIQTLEGAKVVSIAAGGWHSTAITDSGDLYVWGWNESGQLGLPNGNTAASPTSQSSTSQSTTSQSSTSQSTTSQSTTSNMGNNQKRKRSSSFETHSSDEKITVPKVKIANERYNSQHLTMTEESNTVLDDSLCMEVQHVTDSIVNQKLFEMSKPRLQITEENKEHDNSIGGDIKDNAMVEDTYREVPLLLRQDIDTVQIQSLPYGLDLPEHWLVDKVACGSRHTVVIIDSGHVLTCGWNGYGQLGHGDTRTRDYLQTVTYFTDLQHTVTDIHAGAWNTCVNTKDLTMIS